MKRAETESMSFLIGIIITVLILVGVGCIAYKAYSGKEDTLKSFDKLVSRVMAGMEGDMPYYIDENHVLIGFGESGDLGTEDGLVFCYGSAPFQDIKKPESKECKSSCLCLCELKMETLESREQIIADDACLNARCRAVNYKLNGGEACDYVFIPGSDSKGDKRGLATLHISKVGDTLTITEAR